MSDNILTPPPAAAGEATAAGSTQTATDAGSAPAEPQAAAAPQATETQGETKAGEAQAAPEFKITLPDGVEADAALVEALKATGLDNAKAQALVEAHLASQQRAIEAAVAAREAETQSWVESLKADKDFGGAAFDTNVQAAQRAVQRFGDAALVQWLEETGLGNNPHLVRAFAKAGKAIGEDTIAGSTAPPVERSPEAFFRKLYDNSPDLK